MGKEKQYLIYAGIALVALWFLVPGFQVWAKGLFGTGAGGGTTPNPWDGKCLEHDAITMTLGPVMKRYDPGNAGTPSTASNNIYDRVFIDGVDKGLKQDGTTLTVSAGQSVVIYYAENSSDFYAAKTSFEVPCSAAFDSGKYGEANAYKLVAMKNITVVVFNADDSLKNTAIANETIVHHDEADMDMVITFPGVGGIAPYGKFYINVYANASVFDTITLTGEGVVEASPSTYRSKINATTQYVLNTFSIPGRDGQGASKDTFTLGFSTGASGLALDSSLGTNVTISYDDDDWYRNTETGEMVLGPSDNDKTDVGNTGTGQLYTVYFRSA
jgi:hypothetical protein